LGGYGSGTVRPSEGCFRKNALSRLKDFVQMG
jgi:hypothetical protein